MEILFLHLSLFSDCPKFPFVLIINFLLINLDVSCIEVLFELYFCEHCTYLDYNGPLPIVSGEWTTSTSANQIRLSIVI